MKPRSFTKIRKALHSCYNTPKQQRASADVLQGPDLHRFQCEIAREESIQRGYLERGTGCGKQFKLGWAGLSIVRCGATLHSFGKVETLCCPDCGGGEAGTRPLWSDYSI